MNGSLLRQTRVPLGTYDISWRLACQHQTSRLTHTLSIHEHVNNNLPACILLWYRYMTVSDWQCAHERVYTPNQAVADWGRARGVAGEGRHKDEGVNMLANDSLSRRSFVTGSVAATGMALASAGVTSALADEAAPADSGSADLP